MLILSESAVKQFIFSYKSTNITENGNILNVISLCIIFYYIEQYGNFKNSTLQATFLLLGRLGSSSAYATTHLISAEIFATSIRASALGTFSIFSCVFAIAAIFVDFYLPG